jgi:hypothetical protein
MSTILSFYCALRGDSFDPKPLLSNTKISVEDYNCVGDIGKVGRYKNIPYNYGYIRFSGISDCLDDFLDDICMVEIQEIIKKATDRELHLFLEYTKQCNWELSVDEISKIHSLGFVLTITCETID